MTAAPAAELTRRELDVLRLAAAGLTDQQAADRQIADRLGVSVNTVKVHANRLLRRLGAANRTQAVALGYERGHLGVGDANGRRVAAGVAS